MRAIVRPVRLIKSDKQVCIQWSKLRSRSPPECHFHVGRIALVLQGGQLATCLIMMSLVMRREVNLKCYDYIMWQCIQICPSCTNRINSVIYIKWNSYYTRQLMTFLTEYEWLQVAEILCVSVNLQIYQNLSSWVWKDEKSYSHTSSWSTKRDVRMT
jgi:hypothetical protein